MPQNRNTGWTERVVKERFMKPKRLIPCGSICLSMGVLCVGIAYANESAALRLKSSATVLTEIMATPDKGIPEDLLENSECIVIVPGMKKAAFIVGGNYGRGFILCRRPSGMWASWRRLSCMRGWSSFWD